MITRAHAMPFINQSIMVDMADGSRQRGILHTVTNDGLYLRPMSGPRPVSGAGMTEFDIQVLQQSAQSIKDVEETFFPFFFFPFFFVRRIRPFFFI